ncbi:uncharacterized protein LOC128859388 [Anastrepha ludens]|uniref:uncharacterized protein LOC128859388 n=1 Tax=Anastrepha ludens TaxID=28586 RepID=UPI0023B1C22F|nr:uncharacterized protein LOC128859388 [Anastrepha ludens]
MKTLIFKTLVLYLSAIAISAADVPVPIDNYEGMVNDLVKEAQDAALKTAEALEVQYKVTVVEPLDQVDTAVQKIEERREEDANCVAPKDPEIDLVVDTLHEELMACGVVAARTSAQIMIDVNEATQQLVFDGYDLLKLYQKCKNYKNSVLKSTCYTKLSIKATLYLRNSRRSIKTIKQSKQRVPDVFTDANICTNNSADKAVIELESIQVEVDSCINKIFK